MPMPQSASSSSWSGLAAAAYLASTASSSSTGAFGIDLRADADGTRGFARGDAFGRTGVGLTGVASLVRLLTVASGSGTLTPCTCAETTSFIAA